MGNVIQGRCFERQIEEPVFGRTARRAVISKFLRTLGRVLKRLGQWLVAIIVVYLLLAIWAYYSSDAYLPNGAVLNRNVDFDNRSRIDLHRSDWGKLISKDVDRLCWDDSAVWGVGTPGGFIWLGGDHDVIYSNDFRYMETVRQSGLQHPEGGCNGYYRAYLGPALLVDNYYPVTPEHLAGERPDESGGDR